MSGLGQYEFTLNGRRVGTDLLAPGWTGYDRTVLYDTHDVTAMLAPGPNAAGLFLGNGMYHVVRRNRFAKFTGSFGPLRAILHLRLEYADGSVDFVGTDHEMARPTPARSPTRASTAARTTTRASNRADGTRPRSTTVRGRRPSRSSAWRSALRGHSVVG